MLYMGLAKQSPWKFTALYCTNCTDVESPVVSKFPIYILSLSHVHTHLLLC